MCDQIRYLCRTLTTFIANSWRSTPSMLTVWKQVEDIYILPVHVNSIHEWIQHPFDQCANKAVHKFNLCQYQLSWLKWIMFVGGLSCDISKVGSINLSKRSPMKRSVFIKYTVCNYHNNIQNTPLFKFSNRCSYVISEVWFTYLQFPPKYINAPPLNFECGVLLFPKLCIQT